jgi:hypothetical protein
MLIIVIPSAPYTQMVIHKVLAGNCPTMDGGHVCLFTPYFHKGPLYIILNSGSSSITSRMF